jgi:hypothetical protein
MSSPSRCGSPRGRDRGTTCERTRRWGQTWRSSWIGSGIPLPRGPPARSTLTSRRGARKLRLHAYGCRNRSPDPRCLRRRHSAADWAVSGRLAVRPRHPLCCARRRPSAGRPQSLELDCSFGKGPPDRAEPRPERAQSVSDDAAGVRSHAGAVRRSGWWPPPSRSATWPSAPSSARSGRSPRRPQR